jgi:hypothetical protein
VALCREGALARTGLAHGQGSRASGCGFRCHKTPRPWVNGTSSSLERTLARASWRTLIETSRVLRQLFHEMVHQVAHLRSEADSPPPPKTQVAVWDLFLSPSPSVTPATFDRFEIVWRGAARCSVVRLPTRLTDNSTAAAALFAIPSTPGWCKEAR